MWLSRPPCLESPKPWPLSRVWTTLSCACAVLKVGVAYAFTVNPTDKEHTMNRARADNKHTDFTLHVLTWRSDIGLNLIARSNMCNTLLFY